MPLALVLHERQKACHWHWCCMKRQRACHWHWCCMTDSKHAIGTGATWETASMPLVCSRRVQGFSAAEIKIIPDPEHMQRPQGVRGLPQLRPQNSVVTLVSSACWQNCDVKDTSCSSGEAKWHTSALFLPKQWNTQILCSWLTISFTNTCVYVQLFKCLHHLNRLREV